jgi:hypothetical protein
MTKILEEKKKIYPEWCNVSSDHQLLETVPDAHLIHVNANKAQVSAELKFTSGNSLTIFHRYCTEKMLIKTIITDNYDLLGENRKWKYKLGSKTCVWFQNMSLVPKFCRELC